AWRHLGDQERSEIDSPTDSKTISIVSRVEKPKPPRSDYVGSAMCAECHTQITDFYHQQAMAKSLADISSAPELEDYAQNNRFNPDAHVSYFVEKTPAGVFHHERMTDDQGQEIYDQAVRVGYVLGSGHQGRAYLMDRGGLLFMSPISWYSNA